MSDAWRYAVWPSSRSRSQASEVPKIALFKVYLLRHLQRELANDHLFLNYSTIPKYDWAGFLKFVLVFLCHVILNLEGSLRLVRPEKFFRFQWNLVCTYRSMSDARRYAVWPDPRSGSRSRVTESHSRGVDCQSRMGLNFFHLQLPKYIT